MKNYHIIILAGFSLLLSACSYRVAYFGDKLTPTSNVDIYYSTHDVKRQYKVIGHMNIGNIGQETVKAKFVAYAKTIGADAVVITGNTIDSGGKTGSDVVNADALKYEN